MLGVTLKAERIFIGEQFSVSFQRTQRVNDLRSPPSWGALPIEAVPQNFRHLANTSAEKNLFQIPVAEEEAVWLGFQGSVPHAVKIGVGGRNAITGEEWNDKLNAEPQNYLVCPPQLSFETMDNDQSSRSQIVGGATSLDPVNWAANLISLMVYAPKHLPLDLGGSTASDESILHDPGHMMDGRTAQEVQRDPFGIETWDTTRMGTCHVYMLAHDQYRAITGRRPPAKRAPEDVYRGNYLP